MRAPFVLPQIALVLVGVFFCLLYTGQWPHWALRFELMPESAYKQDIAGGDFRLYWAQGHLAAGGNPLGAYSASQMMDTAHMNSLRGRADVRPSFYPPHFVLMMEPLGHLTYPQAWHLFNWGSVLLMAFMTVFAFRREYYALPLLLGFGGLWSALSFGQNSILLASFYLALAAWGARHEKVGGLLLSLASFKPHMGIFAPLMLLWRAQYTTILWAVLGLSAFGLAVFLHYGPGMWLRYAEVIQEPVNRLVGFDNVQSQHMISLYAGLRRYGIEPVHALAAQGALALLALQMLWRVCRRALDPMLPVAAMITATLLAVPHAYSYDLMLLFIPIMVIVKRAQVQGWSWKDIEALLPAYAVPYYVAQLNQVLVFPVVPLVLLLLLHRLKQHSRLDHV